MYNFPEVGYNLLLVEDNPGDILLISDYLEQISYQIRIESAKTYHEASGYIRNRPGYYDVILLDLKLTDIEGEDLIKGILELSETAPVIVLTGHDDMHFSIKSLSLGVFKTNIYRSIQELYNNILKHSKATTAVITIEEIRKILYITINDNGIGFNYTDNDRLGLGIKNVESRIQRLGGVIDFMKSANGGLQVDMEIPVNFARPDSVLKH